MPYNAAEQSSSFFLFHDKTMVFLYKRASELSSESSLQKIIQNEFQRSGAEAIDAATSTAKKVEEKNNSQNSAQSTNIYELVAAPLAAQDESTRQYHDKLLLRHTQVLRNSTPISQHQTACHERA